MRDGGKRAVCVWHRRGGKDSCSLNFSAVAAIQKPGVYWHMLPTQKQGRKVIWDGIDKRGRKLIDQAFPNKIRKKVNDSEMKIELINGAIWQVVGSDNYDSLVGSNPVGIVFSEYSLADPMAWDYLRPILLENGGWAVFIYTPRGKNHGYKLYNMANENPDWFCEKLSIETTNAFPLALIEEERRSGMREELIQQEYYCSFDAAVIGAYYAPQISNMEREGRITTVAWDPNLDVGTAWDVGMDDMTSIFFYQLVGNQVRVINHYRNHSKGFDHYAKFLKDLPYRWGKGMQLFPHDMAVREMSAEGKSRSVVMEDYMGKQSQFQVDIVARVPVEDGIELVRRLLPRVVMDNISCKTAIEALSLYRSEWDDKTHTPRMRPVHDWTSHDADALRTLAVGLRDNLGLQFILQPSAGDYDPFNMYASGRTDTYDDFNPFLL